MSTITVTVTDGAGAAPPQGTTIVLSATLGTLVDSVGSLTNGLFHTTFSASGIAGQAFVQAQIESSIGQAAIRVLAPDDSVFLISHVEPNVADPAGGQIVDIFGQNIREPVKVTFGSIDAEVVSVSSNRIRVRAPTLFGLGAGDTETVNVNVTSGFGTEFQASDTLQGVFTYAHGGSANTPVLFSLTPNVGPNSGGTPVTIRGTGFVAPVQVFFGMGSQTVEAELVSVTSSELRVLTPPASAFGQGNLNSPVDVWVVNLTTGASSSPLTFRYGTEMFITSILPAVGTTDGGENVTIFGSGFVAPVEVRVGGVDGVQQQVISVSGTQIVFRTAEVEVENCSPESGGGAIFVLNLQSGDSATGPAFTYEPTEPRIFTIAPTTSLQGGGGVATFSGSGFDPLPPGIRVKFGSATSASSSAASATMATAVIPAFAGTFNEVGCDDNMDGTQGLRFVPSAVDVELINLATDCSDSVSGLFSYTPSDTSCRGDTGPPLPACSDGVDNDMDGFIDFPADPECMSATDNDEAA